MTTPWKQSKGLTIIYVGDGKGKTTAAVGAAVRALGHGWSVYVAQFMKEERWPSGEREFFRSVFAASRGDTPLDSQGRNTLQPSPFLNSSLATLGTDLIPPLSRSESTPARDAASIGSIAFDVFGEGFVGIMGDKKERETHKNAALAGLARAMEQLVSRKYQLVVLDEILSAVDEGLLTEQQILDLMVGKPIDATLIMTGHKSYPAIFAKADLVTEMKKMKHPFDSGFIAKRGVDY